MCVCTLINAYDFTSALRYYLTNNRDHMSSRSLSGCVYCRNDVTVFQLSNISDNPPTPFFCMFHIWMNSTLFQVRIIHAKRQIFFNFFLYFFILGLTKCLSMSKLRCNPDVVRHVHNYVQRVLNKHSSSQS